MSAPAGPRHVFLHRILVHDQRTYHVPGLAMVIVRNGHVLFEGSAGYANRSRHQPVSVQHTIFHLANTSAVFTTLAALQLAAARRLHLHANVNRYLTAFQLPATFRQPVTTAELLDNTAGFQDRHIGRRTLSPSGLQPLGPYLKSWMPPRVQPPGLAYSYSAYSYALAGLVAQDVSGLPFPAAVAAEVFDPLNMRHSSFKQRLPAGWQRRLAVGYEGPANRPEAAPREYYNVAPAEGMVATVADIGRFLSALTNHGRFHGRVVFPQAVLDGLKRQRYTAYPRLPGFPAFPGDTYGFGRYHQNGRLLIEHSGAVRGFSSLLAWLPRDHLGFFIVGSTAGSDYLFDIQRRLLNHLYAASRPTPHPAVRPGSAGRFAGTYWIDGYPRTTIEKLRELAEQIQVTTVDKNQLSVRQLGAAPVHLTQVAPELFQQVSNDTVSYWGFQTHDGTRMATGGDTVYDRVPWYNARSIQLGYAGALLLIFLSACVVWLLVPLVTPLRRGFAGLVAGMTSAVIVIFAAALGAALLSAEATASQHYSWLEYQPAWWVYAILTLPLLSTILTAVLIPATAAVLAHARHPLWARVHLTLTAMAAVALLPFLLYWNLLGYNL